MNARFYDPNTNRLITPDVIVPDPGNSQAFNRYSYVNNNPINYIDPSGHCQEDPYDDYVDYDCWTLQSWIFGELNSGAKYIVLDGFVFDMAHAMDNWRLAKSIYDQWATGLVNLNWAGFEGSFAVDPTLSGDALDQAAYSLWSQFVYDKEVAQSGPSSFSREDLASNYLGFISYVKGSRDPEQMFFDMANTLADFSRFHIEAGTMSANRSSFGLRYDHEPTLVQYLVQEVGAMIGYGINAYESQYLSPSRGRLSAGLRVTSAYWPNEYFQPHFTHNGWGQLTGIGGGNGAY